MTPESKAIIDILIKVMKFAISQFEILLRDEKKLLRGGKPVEQSYPTGEPPLTRGAGSP